MSGVNPQDLIADLQRLAEENPDKSMSRNFYRANGVFSEAEWSSCFGTFLEFKRAAGLDDSRHVGKIKRQIAKHASVDKLRQVNIDKAGWEDAYTRQNDGRFKTVLVCSDLHDRYCDRFYWRVFVDTALRASPDDIVLNGDIFDLFEFSRFSKDPRKWDTAGRIRVVHEMLGELREVAPEATIHFVEGNHEFRLLRHLAEQSPAVMEILGDLIGLTVPDLLGLQKFEINYVGRADLTAFRETDIKKEVAKNYVILYDTLLFSHFPDARDMGHPGANGHHHKHVVWPGYNPTFGAFEWHQLGCGHVRNSEYCDGAQWSNGFLIAHVDTQTKASQLSYIDIKDFCEVGGRWYQREDNERYAA